MLVADGHACDGLLLLAYPLHPAGQPEKLRDAHLPRILAPTLCLNGTQGRALPARTYGRRGRATGDELDDALAGGR